MNIINGKVDIKKKKKNIKEELSDLDIEITTSKNTLIIKFNKLLKPYQRNRIGKSGTNVYDPLNSYKDYIQKKLINKLKECNLNNFPIIQENNEIEINTLIHIEPPKNFSKMKKLYCLRGKINPISKPDNDNYEKTIFDIMNKIIWKDDSNIVQNITKKSYYYRNETIITIKYSSQISINNTRITNELKKLLSEEEIKYLYGGE